MFPGAVLAASDLDASSGLEHFGESNALDVGGNNVAYFTTDNGALNVVIAPVIPEPAVCLLVSLGGFAGLRRRR